MWKGRPVIGSAVGGIIDQIAAGAGILLPDSADLAGFGSAARAPARRSGPGGAVGAGRACPDPRAVRRRCASAGYAELLGTLIGEG